jgi:glucuronate isomerase
MQAFLSDDFILHNDTAKVLYHEHAAAMPIIDYHCHLSPKDLAEDRQFENLTKIWLEGDHYKWRAMRTYGVAEKYITGEADDYEKFEKWAQVVPHTMRNPLYHWTHMELRRPFGIGRLLNPASAREIYEDCTRMLQQPAFSARGLLQQMKVEVVCTTDDPADSLAWHQKIAQDTSFGTKILPTFRPDKALAIDQPVAWRAYLRRLGEAAGVEISKYKHLLEALDIRMGDFAQVGCRLADHGLETIYAADFKEKEVKAIFKKALLGEEELTKKEVGKFKSALLLHLGQAYHARGWVQQFHLGALRNNNSRLLRRLGPDCGVDSIGDFELARPLSRYLDRLDQYDQLARTILYNLNPRDNELFATMTGNFNDGSVRGKVQFGSGWWFLDQKDGMEKQLNALSNMGLLSCFVGMLTDSRSFLSYPRHEYFRRILCNLIGQEVERGELPAELDHLGQMVRDICYYNAKNYFGF